MKLLLRSFALFFTALVIPLSFASADGAIGAPTSNPVASELVTPAVRDYLPPPPASSRQGFATAASRPGDSLPASSASTHFKVHYDPTANSAQDVSAYLDDLEQAYAKLVSGGGGSPNAGLRPLVSDNGGGGDNRIDFYLTTSDTQCGAGASGCTIPEANPSGGEGYAGYSEVLAGSASTEFGLTAIIAAHEFTHLIEFAYGYTPFLEASAMWGAFWVFPNDPGWSEDPTWMLPTGDGWSLNCHNTTESRCPYRQWPFIERQVEDYGVRFVKTLFEQGWSYEPKGVRDLKEVGDAIALASDDRDTLSGRYASYARQLWEPAAWSEPMRDRLTAWLSYASGRNLVRSEVEINRSSLDIFDSGEQTTLVDQMAALYVRISANSRTIAPGDRLLISVRGPSLPVVGAPITVLVGTPDGRRNEVTLSSVCGTFRCASIPYDSASVSDVVIPLVNDNDPTITGEIRDGQTFTWRAEIDTPRVLFTASRASGTAPLSVSFTNESRYASSYRWSFGDGTPSSSKTSPSHTFTSAGKHTVTLSATVPSGTMEKSVVVTVLAAKPDLTVSLARKKSERVGKLHLASFGVTLRNRGGAVDERVRVRIALPVGASFKSISFRGQKCTRKGRQATCSVKRLSPQKTVKLSFVAAAAKRAKVRVSVSGKRAETSLANNTARVATW
jgi:PKD repeat protein